VVVLGALLLAAAFYLDAVVLNWVVLHQEPGVRSFMRNVSRWGDWPSHIAVGLIGAAVAYLRGNRHWIAIFAAMILACASAGVVNRVIKIAAGRARPSVMLDAGWNGPRLSSKYHAFPSGHTVSSTAFFAALCFAGKRIGLGLLAIPLTIAASRIYLRAHYLSDVVFGAMLGVLCALLVWRFVSRRMGRLEGERLGTAPARV